MTLLRSLPNVDRLVQAVMAATGSALPRDLVVKAARAELDTLRSMVRYDETITELPRFEELVARLVANLTLLTTPSLRSVINASGVILQTNLGRAPLSTAALAAMCRVGQGYSNLEYDLAAGERGSRSVHLEGLLQTLTGAEAALVVNNNAAAIYLALIALASGREVIVSRGQAVEIGGGFRIPDVLRQSGATLVEVGTTNRTYARDYAAAISDHTALIMRIHTSNFRLVGFVYETPLSELVAVGRVRNVAILDDLGSGSLLPTQNYGLHAEPTVQESVAAGADLITFSGDKLLGGPQAGLIVGKAALVDRLRRHPLARALRVDKSTIAGVEATLQAYLRGRAHEEIPVWRMITAAPTQLRERAERIVARLVSVGMHGEVALCESAVGGGALPGETLASVAVALPLASGAAAEYIATALRNGTPAVVARITDNRLLCDLRTVLPEEDDRLVQQLERIVCPR